MILLVVLKADSDNIIETSTVIKSLAGIISFARRKNHQD
jgi:hypothetical protein